jgi:UDP-N-acetylmuramate: L-alanyl-gamma-D-glutamyl-meso-diaminopimelate ligase
LTSLEFDHADIYPNVEAIEREFDKLVALVPNDGLILACVSQPRVLPRTKGARARVETYSARPGADALWCAKDLEVTPQGTRFSLTRGGEGLGRYDLPLYGVYNVENAVAAAATALSLGLSSAELAQGLATFKGVARRQSVRTEIGGVRVIDDFAHHPTAVQETLAGLRARFPQGRLIAVFEPRSATSSRAYFQEDYARAFGVASEVIIAGVGRPEIPAAERLDIERLAKDISASGVPASNIAGVEDIVAKLSASRRSGDTIVIMSNGGFGGIFEKLERALGA